MWLGPAPYRPYNHVYLPFVWRAWYDYGCGAIGDMGEYGFDTIVRALELGPADQVYASSTELFPDCYPVCLDPALSFSPQEPANPPWTCIGTTEASSLPAHPNSHPMRI